MVVAELTKDQKLLLTSALKLIKDTKTGVKASVVEKLEKELKSKSCVLDSSDVNLSDLLTLWNSEPAKVSDGHFRRVEATRGGFLVRARRWLTPLSLFFSFSRIRRQSSAS